MKKQSLFLTITSTVLMCASLSLQAASYVSESFDYGTTGSVVGQNGGSGFNSGSSWLLTTEAGTATESLTTGLSFSGLSSSGGAVSLTATTNGTIGRVEREWGNNTPGNSNLWVSYLINPTTFPINNGSGQTSRIGSQFVTSTASGTTGYIHFTNASKNSSWNTDVNMGAGLSKDPNGETNYTLTNGNTYLVLAKYGNIDYGSYTGNITTVDFYMYSETAFGNLMTAGLTEGNLTGNATATASQTIPYSEFGVSGLDISNLVGFTAGGGASAVFDELNVGTELGDVVNVIPEPNSIFLLVIGLVGVMALRRR